MLLVIHGLFLNMCFLTDFQEKQVSMAELSSCDKISIFCTQKGAQKISDQSFLPKSLQLLAQHCLILILRIESCLGGDVTVGRAEYDLYLDNYPDWPRL